MNDTPLLKNECRVSPLRLKKLLHRLIDIYSPSGKEEAILDYVKNYFRRRDIEIIKQPVDSNRYNIIVAPQDKNIQIAFIGHLDTVEAYDLESYQYQEKEDIVSGLGTADMKGGCAAMIEAFVCLHQLARPSLPPVALCLVVGEEETGDGVSSLMKSFHFPWAIVGEPTNLVPCLSHFGYLEIQIAAEGKRRHASLAKRTQNTVESLLHTMLNFSDFMERQKPDLVYNIRDLFSSRAGFAVPERCEAWIDIHVPPAAPIGLLITELDDICQKQNAGREHINLSFRSVTIDAGYELPQKGMLIDLLKAVFSDRHIPFKPDTFRSHSDANQLWSAGVKPLILGPGQLELAHAQDESISFDQVISASEIYLDLISKFYENVMPHVE